MRGKLRLTLPFKPRPFAHWRQGPPVTDSGDCESTPVCGAALATPFLLYLVLFAHLKAGGINPERSSHFSSHVFLLFSLSLSTSVHPRPAQPLPFHRWCVFKRPGCDASTRNNLGNTAKCQLPVLPDPALLSSGSAGLTLSPFRNTTLGWLLEDIVLFAGFSGKFVFVL